MPPSSLYLDRQQLLDAIALTPLTSIDLVVKDPNGRVLMGLRMNEPARGTWFVPGGRICKGETLEAAFSRISLAELGRALSLNNAKLMGAFTHLYDSNFGRVPGLSTHYVVLAYELQVDEAFTPPQDDQHSRFQWFGPSDAIDAVHDYAKAYLDWSRTGVQD